MLSNTNMNIRNLIALIIVFFFNSSHSILKPKSINSIKRVEPTYLRYSNDLFTLKYIREGMIISGFVNQKYKIDFIDGKHLVFSKIEDLRKYIERNDIWNMSDIYHNKVVVLGGFSYQFVLSDSDELKYKTIYLSNCYNEKLDSLRYYLFELVPPKYKKKYKLEYYSYEKEDPCACSIKDK